ncbi:uncharacterized protein LOC106755668 isoform X3 [Vigna radiata var. radiata]|uniref:Uncharacterized protein LOC106755668 isoform X3 n=1 Tax=Vigna radiata var. radiata TaxID=3916 RepID=A0A3Q0ET76_VIGRR|nr:uncharacterized protein LOC106755668 isoform X3 [Vigna radiata var. radiata]
MDPFGTNRLPSRKPSASERYLGVPSHAPPHSPFVATNVELQEDDVVFFNGDYHTDLNHYNASTPSSSTSSSASATPNHHLLHHHHNHNHHPHGILAALPENETSHSLRNVSQHFHKASISSISSASSSSSSSRVIPAIPRPPPPAQPSSFKFHQSAPVNVPILSDKARRRQCEFDDDDEEDEDGEMVPPHEIVARNSAQSPILAYSVMEGIGRTLKGRDLRQVRNAVWRQTDVLWRLCKWKCIYKCGLFLSFKHVPMELEAPTGS